MGEDGNASRKNATCLIVMGKMIENGVAVGDSYYYRVDFTQKVTIEEGTGGRVYAFDAKLQICC